MKLPNLLLAIITSSAMAGDWPAYRGPNGDGISSETVASTLPAEGPKLLWRIPTALGFSSWSVAGGRAFTTVLKTNEGRKEFCLAVDASTGKELWAVETGTAKYQGGGDSGAEGNRGGDGPRSTPTVSEGKVYVYSADMVLTCLDASTGKKVWAHDILKEFAGKNIPWSSAMSPVVSGKLVYAAGGGEGQSMLAFDKASGEVVWKSGSAAMTHATPTVADIEGVPQVLFLMQSGAISLDPEKGTELWSFAHPYRTATACSPVVGGNVVFLTAFYEVGAVACKVTRQGDSFTATELWRQKGNSATASLWSTPISYQGHLYGMISGKKYGTGPFKCVDLADGSVKWEEPGFGAGNAILAGQTLIALSDDGHVSFIEADPAAFRQTARFKAVEGKCWSTPALAGGKLYLRSTREGACFEIPTK